LVRKGDLYLLVRRVVQIRTTGKRIGASIRALEKKKWDRRFRDGKGGARGQQEKGGSVRAGQQDRKQRGERGRKGG